MADRERRTSTRRRVLTATGIGIISGLAGCAGNGESPGNEGENGDDTAGENTPAEDTTENDTDGGGAETETTEADLSEPIEVPGDAECPVCNMIPAEYPEWNAQLVHENGHRAFFDTSGCLAAYKSDIDRFGGPESGLEAAWVTGFETGEFIEASEAFFVRVTDPDHVDDVMMRNPTPFSDRSDAEAFVDEFEEYDEDDIITFDEFDQDLAMLYRERFIEGDGGMDGDMGDGEMDGD